MSQLKLRPKACATFQLKKDVDADSVTASEIIIIPIYDFESSSGIVLPKGTILYNQGDNNVYYSDGTTLYGLVNQIQFQALADLLDESVEFLTQFITNVQTTLNNFITQQTNFNNETTITLNEHDTRLTTLETDVGTLQTDVTTLQTDVDILEELVEDPVLSASEVLLELPPIVAHRTVWDQLEYQVATSDAQQQIRPDDDTAGDWRPTHLNNFYYTGDPPTTVEVRPWEDGVFNPLTKEVLTITHESMPRDFNIKVETKALDNPATLEQDFQPIRNATDRTALNIATSNFNSFHPASDTIELKNQRAHLVNYAPAVALFENNPYTVASAINIWADKLINFVINAIGAIPTLSGAATVIEAGVTISNAIAEYSATNFPPNPDLPFTDDIIIPIESWSTTESTYNVSIAEVRNFIEFDNNVPAPTILNPPPIDPDYNDPEFTQVIEPTQSQLFEGPWNAGVSILIFGYRIRYRMNRAQTLYLRSFPATHIYEGLPRTQTLGMPGLFQQPVIKGENSTTISPYDYAQYRLDFSYDPRDTSDSDALIRSLDPNVYNSVWLNNKIYAIYNGTRWVKTSNVISPAARF